jgi:putative sigma-54 modulation protein
MKITYTGRQIELAPAQLKKVQARFAKIGKLLDGRKESEAHVVLSLERHLHHAEVTVNYHGNAMVGLGSNVDLFAAISDASEKLEKQAVKVTTKWRDTKRKPRAAAQSEPEPEPAEAEAHAETGSGAEPEPESTRQIYRVNHHQKRKPMTLEEALLVMEKGRDYLVYRDAETDKVAVLVRRRDGDFDLVEG